MFHLMTCFAYNELEKQLKCNNTIRSNSYSVSGLRASSCMLLRRSVSDKSCLLSGMMGIHRLDMSPFSFKLKLHDDIFLALPSFKNFKWRWQNSKHCFENRISVQAFSLLHGILTSNSYETSFWDTTGWVFKLYIYLNSSI